MNITQYTQSHGTHKYAPFFSQRQETKEDGERFSTCWFTPYTSTTARASPGWSRNPELPHSRRQQMMVHVVGSPPLVWESCVEFLGLQFPPGQPQLSQALGELTKVGEHSRLLSSVSFLPLPHPHPLSTSQINTF